MIKDKARNVGCVDNYRSIALAGVLSKVLERILLDRLNAHMQTSDNQIGFKARLGTDLCIFALKIRKAQSADRRQAAQFMHVL